MGVVHGPETVSVHGVSTSIWSRPSCSYQVPVILASPPENVFLGRHFESKTLSLPNSASVVNALSMINDCFYNIIVEITWISTFCI